MATGNARKFWKGSRRSDPRRAPAHGQKDEVVHQPTFLGGRKFTLADQRRFAILSGDRNPMHLDVLFARRTQAGAPVVHGVHAMLWAMEKLSTVEAFPTANSLRARFEKFIYLNERVTATLDHRSAGELIVELSSGGGRVAVVTLGLGARHPDTPWAPAIPLEPTRIQPADRRLEDATGLLGAFQLASGEAAVEAAFPSLCRRLGPSLVNSLIALSPLVGMHCPGLHSIFSKISVQFLAGSGGEGLWFEVRKTQPLFRLLTVDVRGRGVSGWVECFVRRAPVRQPAVETLRSRVAPGAFAGARVLVVGGSRGLGEIVAKITALGGANVMLTYAVGATDAERVAAEIRRGGGDCETLQLDVRQPIPPQLATALHAVSHLYYFATPRIFQQKTSVFSPAVLDGFLAAYASGFYELCQALHAEGDLLRVFYPSSMAVAEAPKDATEYAMAKAAGEVLCAAMIKSNARLDIVVERLPRILTDQTATVLPAKDVPALEILLPIIARMHA
jgi:acyl dehydratase